MIKIEDGDFCKTCELVDKYNELEKENNEQDEYIKYWQEQCDLKQQRIDKAIEYTSNELLVYDNESDEYLVGNRILEILKGDSNE